MKSQVTKSNLTITVCVSFCVLIIVYVTINFQFKKTSTSPAPTILPENVFAFNSVPQDGRVGGIDGVFIQQASWLADFIDEIDCKHYDVFRFYSDGIVLHQGVCGKENESFLQSWTNINKWFNRDTYIDISRGKYQISGKQIWFSTTSHYSDDYPSITVDYSGTFSESKLMLDSYSHFNGNEGKKEKYFKIDFEQ